MAAGLGSNGAPLTAIAVLEPLFTASGALEVVLATEDGNILGEKNEIIVSSLTTDCRARATLIPYMIPGTIQLLYLSKTWLSG